MNAKSLIELITEAANYDRGLTGIDLEMLVRIDLILEPRHLEKLKPNAQDLKTLKKLKPEDPEHQRVSRKYRVPLVYGPPDIAKQFRAVLFDSEFSDSRDTSIHRNFWSKDLFYVGFETAHSSPDGPQKWSKVYEGLVRLLNWLRREDACTTKSPLSDLDPKIRNFMLPRAKVPNNPTAATHLHFDVSTWFESVEHAQAFSVAFNQSAKVLKSVTYPPRYGLPGKHGNDYAPFHKLSTTHKLPGAARFWPMTDQMQWWLKATGKEKFMAMNAYSAMDHNRGDIEFRFMHSTLSAETINSFFKLCAELIEFSRKPGIYTPQNPQSFTDYLKAEAPEVHQDVAQRASRLAKAKGPWTDLPQNQDTSRRAGRRLLKTTGSKDPEQHTSKWYNKTADSEYEYQD